LSEFGYRCVDPSGKSVDGVIAATDPQEAKSKLRLRGLLVLDLIQKSQARRSIRFWGKKINDEDIYNLSREFCILLGSGMKIDFAFRTMIDSVSKAELRETLGKILQEISAGKSVAQSFADTGKFSPLMTATIHVGESVGDLKTAFENFATYMKFQINFKNEVRNATTYPVFLLFASIVTLVFIFKLIIPRFFSIFGEASVATLPLPARLLYTMSNALNVASLYIMVALVGIAVMAKKSSYMKDLYARAYASIIFLPLIGKLTLYLELSRFSFSMFSMLNSGIEFIKALTLSTGLIQNRYVRESIEPSIAQIKEGKKIAEVFSQITLLPNIVSNMITVGEGSGNLKEIFFEIHQMFDERFKNTVKRVLILVEPTIITLMGLIVGFIVLSLILTVMSASNIKL
jgi:general secretion pathway protein F